mmetsp:Transcript_40679/g.73296  ORF Transcript_40679/g.73296 Transcript_40679/m.73296 type:complete len:268 (+) Transcript_40679:883-1686(+)
MGIDFVHRSVGHHSLQGAFPVTCHRHRLSCNLLGCVFHHVHCLVAQTQPLANLQDSLWLLVSTVRRAEDEIAEDIKITELHWFLRHVKHSQVWRDEEHARSHSARDKQACNHLQQSPLPTASASGNCHETALRKHEARVVQHVITSSGPCVVCKGYVRATYSQQVLRICCLLQELTSHHDVLRSHDIAVRRYALEELSVRFYLCIQTLLQLPSASLQPIHRVYRHVHIVNNVPQRGHCSLDGEHILIGSLIGCSNASPNGHSGQENT